MPFEQGIYEQLITKIISTKLSNLGEELFFVRSITLDKAEASRYLSQYLSETISFALDTIKQDNDILRKVEISNKIIQLLIEELPDLKLSDNLIENEGKLLQAVFKKLDFPYTEFTERIKQIMPYTRLTQSELFTGTQLL